MWLRDDVAGRAGPRGVESDRNRPSGEVSTDCEEESGGGERGGEEKKGRIENEEEDGGEGRRGENFPTYPEYSIEFLIK